MSIAAAIFRQEIFPGGAGPQAVQQRQHGFTLPVLYRLEQSHPARGTNAQPLLQKTHGTMMARQKRRVSVRGRFAAVLVVVAVRGAPQLLHAVRSVVLWS